ncbi:hypothetical protein HGRIS_007521 [Hohenbuehelia grisea]|uniref:NADPH-dependent FMN reductase-like domain-containing protein n=1 Tax=Hohenbuehelia grisea TaxID=104357 RepID=A0ABR3J531_9AGAR
MRPFLQPQPRHHLSASSLSLIGSKTHAPEQKFFSFAVITPLLMKRLVRGQGIPKRHMSLFLEGERRKEMKEGCTPVRLGIIISSMYSTKQYSPALYLAMRQTWEEIGIDLAEREYICVGQLDDREITTSLGKRLLMILSPFVFLQVSPQSPPPDPTPSTTLHWTPLASLVSPHSPPRWSNVTVDTASRLASKHSNFLRILMRCLVGSMQFPAIILEPSSSLSAPPPITDFKSASVVEKGIVSIDPPQTLKLWGLSLGMMLDLMSYMILPFPQASVGYMTGNGNGNRNGVNGDPKTPSHLSPIMQLPYQEDGEGIRMEIVAPSLASVFPRFSYPDVNFWIWYAAMNHVDLIDHVKLMLLSVRVFGKRYRAVVQGWEASVRAGGSNDRRYVV